MNILHYAKNILKLEPFTKHMVFASVALNEFCPDCSIPVTCFKDISAGMDIDSVFGSDIVLYENDVCPKCNAHRSEHFIQGKHLKKNDIGVMLGQRSGTTTLMNMLHAYLLNKMLTPSFRSSIKDAEDKLLVTIVYGQHSIANSSLKEEFKWFLSKDPSFFGHKYDDVTEHLTVVPDLNVGFVFSDKIFNDLDEIKHNAHVVSIHVDQMSWMTEHWARAYLYPAQETLKHSRTCITADHKSGYLFLSGSFNSFVDPLVTWIEGHEFKQNCLTVRRKTWEWNPYVKEESLRGKDNNWMRDFSLGTEDSPFTYL